MRTSCSMKYHSVCFLLEYLFLLAMTSFTLGVFDPVYEVKCEYEDANLIWRNMPAYSLNDVKAMAWYKEKDSLIATWLEGKGIKEYPPYIGRLIQIGETGIKLKRANRSDSGSYWLSLTLASTDQKLEAVIPLEIIVPPTNKCKPKITEEAPKLIADLPSEECGTPPLTLKWKNTSKTVIKKSHTSSILDLGRNSVPGEYVVCAEGDSAMCYHWNISNLCTGHTISQHELRDDESTPASVSIILPIALVALTVLVVSILAVIWWKRKKFYRNRQSEGMCPPVEANPTESAQTCQQSEEIPLIEKDQTLKEDVNLSQGLPEIQNFLRGLYKDMTSVSLSPTGKENFVDASEIYIDLDFQQLEARDLRSKETDLTLKSCKASVSKEDLHTGKAHTHNVSPIVIAGCSGSGKSTWCKHLVHCWSQNPTNEDPNIKGINLTNLGEYQVLLYLPLKSSDRGLSLEELLKQILFQKEPDYFNIITKYMNDESHAQSILILVDGFDIISENVQPMSELFNHKLLSLCTVIFTCRPGSLKLIFNACVDISIQLKLYQVCEIPLDKSTTYASKVLSRFSQQNKDFNIKNFLIFTRNLNVQSLLKLPYLCLTLVFVWMENTNPYIEITDILLRIMEHLLDSAKTDRRCKEKMTKLLQGNPPTVHTSVNKLDDRFVKIKDIMYEFSMTTEYIFMCETKGFTDEERLGRGNPAKGQDKLTIEVLHEIGIVTESNEDLTSFTFTNDLIYQLFVSMAIAFKKGLAFDYIVSDIEIALKHSMIIHMLWQFSPTLGTEIFAEMRKIKAKQREKLVLSGQIKKCRYSVTELHKKKKKHVKWLQLLMYKGHLDNEKLLFLTNALRSMDSFYSLVLENNENHDNLVFWLPCSQNLTKLTLNISNCTLLLCPEWNHQIPEKLKEVAIKSVSISSCDLNVLSKAIGSCKKIKKQEMTTKLDSTSDD